MLNTKTDAGRLYISMLLHIIIRSEIVRYTAKIEWVHRNDNMYRKAAWKTKFLTIYDHLKLNTGVIVDVCLPHALVVKIEDYL